MRNLVTIFVLMTGLMTSVFGQTGNMVSSKSFKVEAGKTIVVELNENIVVKEWDQSHMAVVTTITPKNYSVDKLAWFVSKGMFNTAVKDNEDETVLFYPLADKSFRINGKYTLQEIEYVINVPKGTNIEVTRVGTSEDF